ncbi:hypothetical protein [Inquilinus sp.]|uniref:hypothetical protein n=1 Tax=Inquilinus sp. TaxID=1932117 RepID=UPI0031D90E78
MLAACATTQDSSTHSSDSGVEQISFEAEPGFGCGRCDSFKIIAYSDGRVWIEHGYWAVEKDGEYSDWQIVHRRDRVAPERFRRLRDDLLPYRPDGTVLLGDEASCRIYATDSGGLHVKWHGPSSDAHLRIDLGCVSETLQPTMNAVKVAPSKLGIPDLPEPWSQWAVASTE